MSWLPIILLAVATFAVAAFLLKLERQNWMMFAAVLTFGLAGYALQGSPEAPSAPKLAVFNENQSGEAIVAARRALFDPSQPIPSYLTVSDGFARQGRFEEAAQLLRSGTAENPSGQVTPASLYAYSKAEAVMPGNPGPAYFLGVALLRSGMPGQARQVWAELLANSPEDAPWRQDMQLRIDRLDDMLQQVPVPGG